MSSIRPSALLGKKRLIDHSISSYRISYHDLVEYLQNMFEEDAFRVMHSQDHYVLALPRHLSEEENLDLQKLRTADAAEWAPAQRDPLISSHTASNPSDDGSEPFVPYYKASGSSTSPIPSKDKDLSGFGSITDAQISSQGSTSALYSDMISDRPTGHLYAVDTPWSWVKARASPRQDSRGRKVVVKRLAHGTTPQEFIKEYQALKAATRSRHRNIVEFLGAFQYEDENKMVYYNFSFPIAFCSLKELLASGDRDSQQDSTNPNQSFGNIQITGDFYDLARQNLWYEFEGLANGLAYLHEQCQIVHSDITPSNILLYESSRTERIIVAKLTDFGMAIDLRTKLSWRLGSKEGQSAWQHNASIFRDHVNDNAALGLSATELKGGDIWKLGSVFVELLTFLVTGLDGLPQFREFITTTHRELTSDGISDTRFDDGKRVKAEVLEWTSRLASLDLRVRELEPILQSMLSLIDSRPTALAVSNALRKSSMCLYFDGMRYLQFTPSPWVRFPRLVDRCQEYLEKWIGHRVDWRPLRDPERACPSGHTRISWLLKRKSLYVDVPDSVAQCYRDTCRPLSCFSQPSSHPSDLSDSSPTFRSSGGLYSQPGVDLGTLGREPTLTLIPSESHYEEGTVNESIGHSRRISIPQMHVIWKEIYWCVDQAWSEPRVTRLCSLRERPHISDDVSLCRHLIQEYNRVRTWKGRYLSWKSCLAVEFIRFTPAKREDHVLKIQNGLPPSNLKSYEYILKQPEQVHMMIAAEQLVHLFHNPDNGIKGDDRILKMIPKRLIFTSQTTQNPTSRANTPCPISDAEDDKWGIYARARFSLWKILAWITGVIVLGLVFVILWLTFVDERDLQNAVIPYTVCAMGMMMGLGIPQFLEVD